MKLRSSSSLECPLMAPTAAFVMLQRCPRTRAPPTGSPLIPTFLMHVVGQSWRGAGTGANRRILGRPVTGAKGKRCRPGVSKGRGEAKTSRGDLKMLSLHVDLLWVFVSCKRLLCVCVCVFADLLLLGPRQETFGLFQVSALKPTTRIRKTTSFSQSLEGQNLEQIMVLVETPALWLGSGLAVQAIGPVVRGGPPNMHPNWQLTL